MPSQTQMRLTLIFFSLFTFTACASNKAERNRPSTFLTRISDSGLKHFELRVGGPSASSPTQRNRGARQNDRPARDPAKQFEKSLIKMRKSAEALIEENGYCKSGFWVLDFDIDTRGQFLRGECNELATEEDYTLYPDTIKNW